MDLHDLINFEELGSILGVEHNIGCILPTLPYDLVAFQFSMFNPSIPYVHGLQQHTLKKPFYYNDYISM